MDDYKGVTYLHNRVFVSLLALLIDLRMVNIGLGSIHMVNGNVLVGQGEDHELFVSWVGS